MLYLFLESEINIGVMCLKKKYVIIVSLLLAMWFFLDMIGVYIGDKYLVTKSIQDDGIFFIIYILSLLIFVFKEKIGKYILNIWLIIWLISQFMFHWFSTITGIGISKIEYFKDSIKLINMENRYIPDLYHIILHLLIILVVVFLNIYLCKNKRDK